MEINLSKKIILHILVLLWIIFSVAYIIWDIWSDFKNVQMFQAYEQGRTDTINVLIQEAGKCELIPIFSGEKEIQLVNIDCLETIE